MFDLTSGGAHAKSRHHIHKAEDLLSKADAHGGPTRKLLYAEANTHALVALYYQGEARKEVSKVANDQAARQ